MNIGTLSGPVSFPTDTLGPAPARDIGSGGSFGDALKSAIGRVSDLQGTAETQVTNLLQSGQGDMGQTMISVEKADVAFQLMMQVRNKVVNAYQDIEKMQF